MEEKIENKVYVGVGGLPDDITEERIKRFFAQQGEIADVQIVPYANHRGAFAFVTFEKTVSAIEAIQEMNGRAIDSQLVKVATYKNRDRDQDQENNDLSREQRKSKQHSLDSPDNRYYSLDNYYYYNTKKVELQKPTQILDEFKEEATDAQIVKMATCKN